MKVYDIITAPGGEDEVIVGLADYDEVYLELVDLDYIYLAEEADWVFSNTQSGIIPECFKTPEYEHDSVVLGPYK